jgi:hypothetical protein
LKHVPERSGRSTHPLFAIRGMGQDFGAAAGSVETYFADVPLSGPFQMPSMGPAFFDLGKAFGGRLSWIGGGLLDQTRQPGGNDG